METLHVVCPHCDTTNRVAKNRLGEGAKCGNCGQPLFSGRPLILTAGNFDRHVSQSAIPVVVDFWAAWCGPCRMMAPAFEQAAARIEPRARLAKLDTEAAPAIAARFAIRSIPTMIVFRGGTEVARHTGAIAQADALVDWVGSHL